MFTVVVLQVNCLLHFFKGIFFLSFVLSLTQTKVIQVEKKLQCIKSRTDGLREEQDSLSEENLKLKEQVKVISRAHKEQEVLIGRYNSLVLCLCKAVFFMHLMLVKAT